MPQIRHVYCLAIGAAGERAFPTSFMLHAFDAFGSFFIGATKSTSSFFSNNPTKLKIVSLIERCAGHVNSFELNELIKINALKIWIWRDDHSYEPTSRMTRKGTMQAISRQSLVVAIVSPERKIHDAITSALDGNVEVETIWTLAEYPDSAALTQLRKAEGGCIIYLDFSDPIRAKAVAAEIDRSYPAASTIAVHPGNRSQDLIEIMQLGVREVVTLPVAAGDVLRAFNRVGHKLKTPPAQDDGRGRLYAFFPAKPGAGATTLAIHCAAAAARLSEQRTLLMDFDFRLGMTSFLLKLNGSYSVLDAIAARAQMDCELWDRMVCRRGTLDILGSAPVEFGNMNPESGAVELIDFACNAYQAIYVDLPGEMREYELETMNLAKECLLVTASDIGSLHMAKRKSEALRSMGLHSKISVIMNRTEGRTGMAIKDIEAILQLPVRFSVPSAEREITEATHAGKPVEGRSAIVTQVESIARRLTPGAPAVGASKPRHFIEMFSVSTVRDRHRWGT